MMIRDEGYQFKPMEKVLAAVRSRSACVAPPTAFRKSSQRRLVLVVGWQLVSLTLRGQSCALPLPTIQRPRHRLGELPPLLALLGLHNVLAALAVPALLELLAELLVEGQALVGLLLGLALVVVILVVRVDKVGLIVVAALYETRGFEGDGALVAGLVPCFGARVGDAARDGHDDEEGEAEEEHHDDAEGDEVFVHNCGSVVKLFWSCE
jgi:hypothetical protein